MQSSWTIFGTITSVSLCLMRKKRFREIMHLGYQVVAPNFKPISWVEHATIGSVLRPSTATPSRYKVWVLLSTWLPIFHNVLSSRRLLYSVLITIILLLIYLYSWNWLLNFFLYLLCAKLLIFIYKHCFLRFSLLYIVIYYQAIS